jgi:hypothetical protein
VAAEGLGAASQDVGDADQSRDPRRVIFVVALALDEGRSLA